MGVGGKGAYWVTVALLTIVNIGIYNPMWISSVRRLIQTARNGEEFSR